MGKRSKENEAARPENLQNHGFITALYGKESGQFQKIRKNPKNGRAPRASRAAHAHFGNFPGIVWNFLAGFVFFPYSSINDSKSTSFSSSVSLLKTNYKIYWLLGGIHKKGDKFNLSKKYFVNIKAFIYGKSKKFFNKKLKGKIFYKNHNNLKDALKKVFLTIKKEKFVNKTILFSPCAASFDSFKNFEERGLYFNKLIKKHLNAE